MGIVTTIPEAGLDYMLYGDKSNVVKSYLEQQFQSLPQVFSQVGNRIYQAMQSSYDYLSDAAARFRLFDRIRQAGVAVEGDYFEPLLSFESLQNATPLMQRWVMAHPQTRELYLDQNLEGYADSYHNVFGNEVGPEDYNWRRVMTGVLVEEGEDDCIRHYVDTLYPGDRPLEFEEKTVVRKMWGYQDLLLATSNFDFTAKSETPVKINREHP